MKTSLWRGLSAVMAFLLILSIFGGMVANANAGGINNYLGICPFGGQHQHNDEQQTDAILHARTCFIFIYPHLHLTIDINR